MTFISTSQKYRGRFFNKKKMSNDFLAQVREMEQKAAEMIEKALKKKNDDLLKYKQELAKKQEASFKKAQDDMKTELRDSKAEERKSYEKVVAEGKTEADKVRADKTNLLYGMMGEAEKLFLSII